MTTSPGSARIGPNAITQVAGALERELGRDFARDMLLACGLAGYINSPPSTMVDEREVIALHRTVRERLSNRAARGVARDAGRRTAEYLLARRIPRPVQVLLKMLPAGLASRILIAAIRRHAWTFVGSGHFTAHAGRPVVITIEACPICSGAHSEAALCDYYAATFERLYSELVHPLATVEETACIAAGGSCCRFEISWR